MYSVLYQSQIDELIACLNKIAPRKCSKPKSEMCQNCLDRISSPTALLIDEYINELKELKVAKGVLTAEVETRIIEFLNSNQK